MRIRAFAEKDTDAVIDLWSRCGLLRPWNDPRKDIARKLHVQRDLFLVGEQDGRIIATAMAGYEGHRGWVNYLAVEPEFRQQGLGRLIMGEVERRLKDLGCPKVCLQVRRGNEEAAAFYKTIGYSDDDVFGMGKWLIEEGGISEDGV
jgi:ribosomal protein S18 acetylase RimI-like enzyme